jgi:hypothetical protein
MRCLTLALFLLAACDDRSYPVGTVPTPDGAVGLPGTGGDQSKTPSDVGSGELVGSGMPGASACANLQSGLPPDRPVTLPPDVLAERLARFIWAGPPNTWLMDRVRAVARSSTAIEVLAQGMTAEPQFVDGVDALAREWLELDTAVAGFGGAEEVRAMADAGLRASMILETSTFVRDLFTAGDARLSTLLMASHSFVNERLAPLYDLPAVTGSGFSRVELDKDRRSGILTQASLLFSKPRISGRGTWVQNKLLCMGVPLPPSSNLEPALSRQPGETDRQHLERSTASPSCRPCHQLIDPPGYALEHYDALGRWRDQDSGQPVDATGTLVDPPLKFDGARQLAQQLVGSCQVQRCLVQVFLQRALGSPDAGTAADREEILRAFVSSGLNLRVLFSHVAASPPFLAP